MTITDQEALEARARRLYRVPPEISPTVFDACGEPVQSHYVPVDPEPSGYRLAAPAHALTPAERYALLECLVDHNGIRMLEVDVGADQATLRVHFYNRNFFDEIMAALGAGAAEHSIFPIRGGRRVPAGDGDDEMHVVRVENPGGDEPVLVLTLEPVGDYSTYSLSIRTQEGPEGEALPELPWIGRASGFDPLFSEIRFRLRPGCFNMDCAPQPTSGVPAGPAPPIDYLAKDYASFKHSLIAAMGQRVAGWRPTSEADLDQVLLDLFCAAADELSDYQDRVMNEAYLGTARKRVSLARHARLMDYHIHQGNQADTWLALELAAIPELGGVGPEPVRVPGEGATLCAWAGNPEPEAPSAVHFCSRGGLPMHPLLNRMGLYTWDGAVPALPAGCNCADLQPLDEDGTPLADEQSAQDLCSLLRSEGFDRLLIQEYLNPATGRAVSRDPRKRQLLRLVSGEAGAETRYDPVGPAWLVRVHWLEEDTLATEYCFSVQCEDGPRHDCSLFHGNLLQIHQGRRVETLFRAPGEPLLDETERHYEPLDGRGTLCRLPEAPLAYRNTGGEGEIPPHSTLAVSVHTEGGTPQTWEETISLVHSDDGTESGDHFMVETDEEGNSLLRFSNGVNGCTLLAGGLVDCTYQVGAGPDGNIGADQLHWCDPATPGVLVARCWNPFDVTNGRAPESRERIIRRAPMAYRQRQLRAVRLQDYIDRAEELPGVSRAAARYAWTGSWRTVRIAIDPAGTATLSPELRRQVTGHLEAVRLIGEDLEIRPPRFVPLDIRVLLCARPGFWPEDLRSVLEQELSEGYTPDGRTGFFHPDLWTFGQGLYPGQLLGRIHQVEGVDHVVSLSIERWNEPTPGSGGAAELRANEVIRVRNDPDHMEHGFVTLDIGGGRE